ncbi:FmdB family transcriptional regulator [Kosmotoga arenicorallina S304]|uniref:FmdB family transcriptional regulator n=1 Tax=Kosmotoga arenicorallina S304 TaxID=1453497 RepID=A0A176K0Y9_9BACT|nr:FmdB family zinc ribbon protein [Kosmotoga arenicorallina]OAA30066.1 FmdB family transcriptional regulator [Kosmotoga arenicorallina S304]
MPRYRYVCESCANEIEAFQKISEEPLTTCPSCGGKLRKAIASVGVVFKGSGFYSTDSRSSSEKTKSSED